MTLRRWVPNGSHVNWKRVSLATGYKRPGDFMRFQVINTRDLANFIQLPLGRFFFRCIKMIHKWSSLIYHVHPTLSFWMYLPWGQRSSQRNKHRTYVVVRQIGQVTWCAETHSHCWMVINPCFIGYCLRYYIYMAMYLLFHRVSTHIYIPILDFVFVFFFLYGMDDHDRYCVRYCIVNAAATLRA